MLCTAMPLAVLAEEQPTEVIFYFLGEDWRMTRSFWRPLTRSSRKS
jgi:hypothetical protein